MFGTYRSRADGVQSTVVRLADHGVDGAYPLHARLREHPAHHCVRRLPDAKRAGEQDRGLQFAKLTELCDAEELAEAVDHVERGWHPVQEGIAAVREYGRDSGPDRISLDDGCLPHANAGHVRDGVVLAGIEDPDYDVQVACACALRVAL